MERNHLLRGRRRSSWTWLVWPWAHKNWSLNLTGELFLVLSTVVKEMKGEGGGNEASWNTELKGCSLQGRAVVSGSQLPWVSWADRLFSGPGCWGWAYLVLPSASVQVWCTRGCSDLLKSFCSVLPLSHCVFWEQCSGVVLQDFEAYHQPQDGGTGDNSCCSEWVLQAANLASHQHSGENVLTCFSWGTVRVGMCQC